MDRKVKLSPNKRQKRILDDLFSGPERLHSLLVEEAVIFQNDAEISFYLLSKKREFYSGLGAENWEYCVEFLKLFARNFMKSGNSDIETESIPNCSISSDQKIYLPLDGIMLINSDDPVKLKEARDNWRKNHRRYSDSFSLVKSAGVYYSKIPLVKDTKVYAPKKPPQKKRQKVTGDISIAKLCRLIAQAELAHAKAYSRVDYDQIEGRSVQGGAIELGKKR